MGNIEQDYDLICEEVPEYKQFTLKEYAEIMMIVTSRIFSFRVDGVEMKGLLPFADMVNHQQVGNSSWMYDDDRQGFIIVALDNIKNGKQVSFSYGKKCNTRFLLNYGFVDPDNDDNEYPFTLEMDKNDQLAIHKMKILNTKSIQRGFRVKMNLAEPIMIEFVSFLRFVEFDEDVEILYEIKDRMEPSSTFKADNVPFISMRNERKVWNKIKKMSEKALARYPETFEED